MKNQRTRAISGLLAGIGCLTMAAPAVAQDGVGNDTETDSAADDATEGNAIIVTGLRESLRDAVSTKRNSLEVVDSITADDIGKLPDANVAETLTRVPGVQAYRFGGEAASPVGEGSGLTIRGLSNLTASRVDGRQFFTAGSREFNIEGAIPGIVAGLDVYKNPTAEHIEGAIGGLVDIRTRKPLDFSDDLAVAAGVTVRYNDLADKARPEYFGLVSKTFDLGSAGEFGVLVAANYQQSINRGDNQPGNGGTNLRRVVRADSAEYASRAELDQSYAGRSDVVYLDSNIAGANSDDIITDVASNFWIFAEEYERTRKGLNVALQWQPNPDLQFNVTGLYNSYLYDQDYRFIISPNSNYVQDLATVPFALDEGLANRNSNGGSSDILASQRFASGTRLDSNLFTLGGREKRLYETGIIAGNIVWNATDALTLSTDVSYVKADQRRRNYNVQLTRAAGTRFDLFRDVTTNPFLYSVSGSNLQDPNTFVFNAFNQDANNKLEDEGVAARFDAEYDLSGAPISAIKAGVRWANIKSEYRDYRHGYSLGGVSATDHQDLLAFAPDNFYDGKAGFEGGFLVFDPNLLFDDVISSRFSGAGIPPLDAYAENLLDRRHFKEDTYAGYLQADYSLLDDRLRGNVGVRAVKTETFARAQVLFTPSDGGDPYIVPREASSSYWNVLPSFNLIYDLGSDTLLRFGYGKGMTRPNLGSLNPTIGVNTSTGTGNQGNPDLEAQTADSLDLSLEHYFGNGGYVAVNGFYKWIDGFFAGVSECQTVDTAPPYPGTDNGCTNGQYMITRQVNADTGTAKGVEVAGQTFFDFGFVPQALHNFGAAASFTFVDTEVPVTIGGQQVTTPQPFVSKYSYSLSGFYEDDLFQARVVYTWRDDAILFGTSAAPIDGRYIGAYGLLDASISFELPHNFTLGLTASNILNAAPDRYVGEPGQYATGILRQPFLNGRVFGASLRYRFGS